MQAKSNFVLVDSTFELDDANLMKPVEENKDMKKGDRAAKMLRWSGKDRPDTHTITSLNMSLLVQGLIKVWRLELSLW